MAVSVLSAAGVVTTQKAAAIRIQPIVITYGPGAKYSFTPNQFRNRAYFNLPPTVKHVEAATGGALYARLNSPTVASGGNGAWLETDWQLKLPSSGPYSSWDVVKNMPCKVTFKVSYYVAAKGDSGTMARVAAAPDEQPYAGEVIVHGNDPIHAKSGIATWTWSGPVGQLFNGDGTDSWAWANVGTALSSGAGQASAALICSSIVLEFPAS